MGISSYKTKDTHLYEWGTPIHNKQKRHAYEEVVVYNDKEPELLYT